jgi:hypothetical protein
MRSRHPATHAPAESCEDQHRPIRALIWQLFGGFVTVVLTLTLAGAAHVSLKADADDVRQVSARTRELEQSLADIQGRLAELRAGQQYMTEELRYIRTRMDEEDKQ